MGFFRRRAKAKNGPAVDHHQQQHDDDYDEEDVYVSRRPPSKVSRHHHQRQRRQSRDDCYHPRRRHDGIYDVDDYPEAVIEELPPEPEQSFDYDNDGSVGDTLATEDHFDLHVPIKQQPKRGILRNHSGPGLMLLPPGRGSFSKIWNTASNASGSTVSSISCDSRLFVEPEDDDDDNNNPQHPTTQENLTISMRSIKSRQSKQSKNNSSRPDPPLNNAAEESSVSPMVMKIDDSDHLSMQQQPPQERRRHTEPGACAGCCGWQDEDDHRRLDIDTRIPSSDDAMASTAARVTNNVARSAIKDPSRADETNTVRGIKTPSKSGKKSHKSSSTLPNDAVEYHIALQSGNSNKASAITESTPRDPQQSPPSSSVIKSTNVDKSDDGNLFASWCSPRQLDLVADDTTSPYKGRSTAKAVAAPTAYRIYEEPLKFEKRDRSLFDPFSYDNEDEEAGQQDRETKIDQQLQHDTKYDEEDEERTYHEEAQTTMAMIEMEDIPMDGRDDDDDDDDFDDDGDHYDDNKEDDFNEETGFDDGYHNEERNTLRRLRLPRNLPTVRNTLSRMSSLSRLRSSGRSQKSGRSRSRSRRRRHRSRSKGKDDDFRNRRRHRSRSRGHSTERRSCHNSRRKHSQQNYITSEEHFRSDRTRRHYGKIPIT